MVFVISPAGPDARAGLGSVLILSCPDAAARKDKEITNGRPSFQPPALADGSLLTKRKEMVNPSN